MNIFRREKRCQDILKPLLLLRLWTQPISFFSEKGYYQFDFKNATNTGTAAVELDFGAGLRLIETVDLTDTARDPFSIVGNIKSARVTPSQEMTMSVYCERA